MNRVRCRLVCVVNYRLPPHDYRIHYAALSEVCDVEFALPERPDADVVWHRVDFGEGLRLREAAALVQLVRLLASLRGSGAVVHFFSSKLVAVGPLLARLLGVPSIVTVTGFGRTFSDRRLRYRVLRAPYRALFRLSAMSARLILFQNTADLGATTAWLPALSSKMHYVGSATAAQPTGAPKPPPPPLRVLTVARLLESKGILDVLEVARRAGSEAAFTIVGPPSASEPQTAAAVAQAHADGVVEYAGQLSADALAKRYSESHVLLFLSHAEGMARVLLEAGVHRLCPVVSDIPANRDVVGPGRGFLVPLGDAAAAAARMDELARDPQALEDNAARFAHHVETGFRPEAYARRLDALLAGTR